MQFDRDLNVALIRALFPPGTGALRGWEMLAATGVRGLRLAEETDAFAQLDLTEQNPAAYAVLERNAHESGHAGLVPRCEDAKRSTRDPSFDYVDLDPFGTPVPFVEAALQALAPDGVLAVTATDMPVLTGVSRQVCERRYGARPIRGAQGPEGGLRILIAFLKSRAGPRSRALRPLLGYVHDHYIRVYLKSEPNPAPPKDDRWVGDPGDSSGEAPPIHGQGPFGPMWLGPLFDREVLARLEVPRTAERPEELRRFLDRIREESTADHPFYYEPNALASELHLREPPSLADLLGALRAKGYGAARSHVRPSAFRTSAPRSVVYSTARALRPGP
jgi:tRNA (guanine26-N2/guanine27-N2)-dimethyltransferase